MEEVRLSEHVVMLRGDGGVYPNGSPLRVTGGDTVVQIDSSLDSGCAAADLIVLSHYHEDHVVGLGETRAPVTVHRRDLPAVASWDEFVRCMNVPPGALGDELKRTFRLSERPDATPFDDDAVIDVGGGVTLRAVPLPGHTGGHCGFFVEPDGVFFTADVDLSSFGPVYADLESTLPDVRASLARCAEIEAAVYTTFHHKGPYTDRAGFLADLATHAAALDAREARLRALLAERPAGEGPTTARELVGRGVVYRVGGRRPWYADAVEEVIIGHHLAETV
ncbi:MAG: MBL fold metallo-hydrolase [Gordonia sp. (in: high G+C Gram-positive bacteria)]|uniref:MBL fold metallo-hydrolase n=1 Tax=Gordonia sp. (in: high G+C Gram-positive bacteria) TaxID=84139 RepID=UPI0039E2837D